MSSGTENRSTIGEIKKISSGIEGLDFQLGGGIPAGSLILLCGDPLSGIEKLSIQFWNADDSGQSSYFMIDSSVMEGMIDAKKTSPSEIFKTMTGKWVVVDSISSLVVEYGINEVIQFLRQCSEKISLEGANMLTVMYEGIHTPYEEVMIKRSCNTVFTLSQNAHGSEVERNLQVNKISGMDVPNRVYPYNILEKGIELSTTARVV